ncbi:MAG: hypothetical protein WCI63_00480 [bacterium]
MSNNKNVKSKAGIQGFLPVKEIKNNLLFLKDGSAKAILSVSGINYYLMSNEEQDILVSSFQEVINSLEFPIQIVVQSRKIDLTEYLKSLQVAAEVETNSLLQEDFFEYIKFIKEVMSVSSIMDKKFYVVIPYFSDYLANQKKGLLSSFFGSTSHDASPQTSFEKITEVMGQRINSLAFSLQSLGVTAKQLNTQELIELMYGCYNHDLPKIGVQSNESGEIG